MDHCLPPDGVMKEAVVVVATCGVGWGGVVDRKGQTTVGTSGQLGASEGESSRRPTATGRQTGAIRGARG